MKGLERVLKEKTEKRMRDMKGMNGMVMAYQKGKSREMALFMASETLLHAMFRSRRSSGRGVILFPLDVKHAYNGTWREKVDIDLWEKYGMRGTDWLLLKQCTEGIHYHIVRDGKLLKQTIRQEDGLAQGPGSCPMKFNISMVPILDAIERANLGILINGKRIAGFSWSDDLTLVLEKGQMGEAIEIIQREAEKIGKQWKAEKCWYMNLSTGEKRKDEKKEGFILDGEKLEHKNAGECLGRWFSYNPEKSPRQIEETIAKANKAIGMMRTLKAMEPGQHWEVTRLVYRALVESTVTAGTTHTQLNKKDAEKLRTVQGKVLRRSMSAGKRCSPIALAVEGNWRLIDARIARMKMKLWQKVINDEGRNQTDDSKVHTRVRLGERKRP